MNGGIRGGRVNGLAGLLSDSQIEFKYRAQVLEQGLLISESAKI